MIELFAILADGVVQVGPIEDLNIYCYEEILYSES